MKHTWNFRRSIFGRMILQRFVTWTNDGHEYGEWRDATTSDLRDYFYDLEAALRGEK